MSSDNSKNRQKRLRLSSEENANNYSFVRNVTSRVTGMLPTTITKWFSSPSSSNTNGSAASDTTDSSSDDEAIEFPVIVQPPAKKMRFYSPANLDNNEKKMSNNSDTRISQKSSQISSKTSILKDAVSTPVQSPIKETNDSKNESPDDRASPEHSIRHIIKRRSIFGNNLDTSNILSINASKNSSNTLRDPKQPSFMPGLLSSPFYSGRTMYGGATSSHINYPNIKQRKTATVKESSNIDNTISHSAKQVMELLEQYSTPLTEARRIPQIVKYSSSNISSLSNSLPTYRTQELHVPSFADLLQLKQRSRLIKTTNTARQILASYSSSMNSSPYPSVNHENEDATLNNTKMTTKVKSRLTRIERGGNNFESSIPSVDLPKGVLQIDKNKLPNLNFGIPVSFRTSTSMQKGHETSTSNKYSNLNINSISKDTNDKPFKFSKPSIISESSALSPKGRPFAFGSPERKIEKSIEGGDKNMDKEPVESQKKWQCSDCWVFNNSDVPKCVCCGGKKVSENNKDVTCSTCKLAKAQANKVTCLNCERNTLSLAESKEQPKSKTFISDVNQSSFVNNKTTDGNTKLPLVTKESQKLLASQSKWKCGDCWVQNDNTSENCVCCGGKKSSSEILVPKDANINILKNNSGVDWSCKVCWIKNKMDLVKCLACEADKPDITENVKSNNIENNFNNIIKTQSNQWECPNCLVKNNKDKLKCICCEEDKPGTEKSKTNTFNFGVPLNTSFKFGINPVDNKVDTAKKTDINSNTENKFKVEETNNNVLTKSTFTFGITPKPIETMKSQDKTDATKEKTTDEKTFTFGIKKSIQTSQIPTSLFGAPKKQDITTNDNPKINESPNVNESSQENVKLKINPFVLSSKANKEMTFPVIKHSNVETIGTTKDEKAVENYATSFVTPVKDSTQIVPDTLIDDKNKNEEKNTTSPPLIPMPDLTNSVEKSKSGSLPNLFGANSNVTSFAPTTQNSTTPSLLVFPKTQNAPVTTAPTSVGLFQKPETSNAPLGFGKFSFGNSNQSIKPPGENPSPFTFVNSKIDPSVFKNTFSMPADKNANPNFNKFSSFAGSSIGGGNGSVPSLLKKSTLLSGNSTDTNNALAAASPKPNPTLSTSSTLIPTNGLSSGTALQSTSNPQVSDVREIFPNTPAQNEQNIWTPSSNVPKPASFTFGNSSTFNPNTALPTFGATTQASTLFGRQNNSTNQASIFTSPEPAQNHQTSNNVFGLSQPTSNPSLGVGGFSNPNAGAVVPPNQAAPSAPSAGPMFNFGNTQRPNVFGFGQGQQQPQPAGVYNFGSSAPSAPQVQFNIGQSDDTKRLRKRAVRRVPQR